MDTNLLCKQSHKSLDDKVGEICAKKKLQMGRLESQCHANDIISDDEDNDEDASSCSTSASANLCNDEIPIHVRGEQRWVSGVTEHTSCNDLIEALLCDDSGSNLLENPVKLSDFVITERWRRVEQVLDGKTKIFKIWTAWGEAQPEVRFTLRHIDHHKVQKLAYEKDSGRGSPTGSINSAIVRRRRHKASKSTFAWVTHGQTIHPKSNKASIERMMKLILEQGEVIQLQLAKLRDRELEITNIEEERHKSREKEHGKNYLIETYLNGLRDDKETSIGNSDSGVHTEETTTSPEIGPRMVEDDSNESKKHGKKPSKSKRESELLMQHDTYIETNTHSLKPPKNDTKTDSNNNETAEQIEMLEKVIVLNKHLQREEELLVRLTAKIKRYEADASGFSELQVKEALHKVNQQLDLGSNEMGKMESEIKCSDDVLEEKTNMLRKLYEELETSDHDECRDNFDTHRQYTTQQDSATNPKTQVGLENGLNLSREYLAENIYNISKAILKSSTVAPSTQCNIKSILREPFPDPVAYGRHTPEPLDNPVLLQPPPQFSSMSVKFQPEPLQIPAYVLPPPPPPVTTSTLPRKQPPIIHTNNSNKSSNKITSTILASMNLNYLDKYNQRNINTNVLTPSATNFKLGPKKFLNGVCSSNHSNNSSNNDGDRDSNSDTGVSSLSDETQMGTLV